MILKPSKPSQSHKWAVFDFDGTLVKPKQHRRFPKDATDWEWVHPRVPEVLHEWAKKKYRMVLLTDQTKAWKLDMIKDVIRLLDIPFTVIIGGWEGAPKKPDTTAFQSLIPKKGLNMKLSFYVGDAAGREGDWAAVDAEFAKAMGLTFYTPEQMFWPREKQKIEKVNGIPVIAEPEVVVFVGFPAAGKTTLYHTYLEPRGYRRIEGDTYKTPEAMVKAAERIREEFPKASLVMDATNGTKKRRELFWAYARRIGYRMRCVWIQTPIEKALERAKEREQRQGIKIPPIALYQYRKHFEEPTEEECGGNPIVKITPS
jgi:bifunctional polynucleotide phosphatase/kinase